MSDFQKNKEISYGRIARDKVIKGIDAVADAVKVTLGPSGRLVLYDGEFGELGITKDGVTVARCIKLKDNSANLGASLIKQSANQTLKGAGDGTTTTCVLAQALIKEGVQVADSGLNVLKFTREMKSIVDKDVIPYIEAQRRNLETDEIIKTTALMSTNHDEELANVVSEVFTTYGKDVVVNLETSDTGETHVYNTPGISINRGYTRGEFAPVDDPTTKWSNCGIVLMDSKVTNPQLLFKNIVMQYFKPGQPASPLLIIAVDFPESFEMDLFKNRVNGIPVLPVRAPYYGKKQKDYLKDIAMFTGATVISETDGTPLDKAGLDCVGVAEQVMVDMTTTTIINTRKSDKVDEYIEVLKTTLENTKNDYDKQNIRERISKLTSGICSIKVYADSDTELREKKDRLDDAIRAVRVALDKGVCPGGGYVFYTKAKEFDDCYGGMTVNDERVTAYKVLAKALKAPFKQLIENSGLDYNYIVEQTGQYNCYNVLTRQVEAVQVTSVVDPIEVLINSIKNALSIASQVLSIGAVISDVPEVESNKQNVQ